MRIEVIFPDQYRVFVNTSPGTLICGALRVGTYLVPIYTNCVVTSIKHLIYENVFNLTGLEPPAQFTKPFTKLAKKNSTKISTTST